MRRSGIVAVLWLASSACSALPVIEAGVCGNAVKEGDEACDTFADTAGGEICRPPGAVGECQYDCRLNADGSRARCPEGRGCAADGICRLHEPGNFAAPVNFSAEVSSYVGSADFDGDGRSDIISTELSEQFQHARFRLHYFDVDAKLVETRTFPRVTTPPLVRDVTHDGKSDLVFSNFRVGLVAGRSDRELIPASFSSYLVANARLCMTSVHHDVVEGASPLVVLKTIDGMSGLYTSDLDAGGLSLRTPQPHGVESLAGALVAADLFEGADSPCAEVVVAYRGDPRFTVYDVCSPGDENSLISQVSWRQAPLEQTVSLPDGLTIDGGPLVADMNADGHLDLVIGAGGHPYLVLGDGERMAPVATNLHLEINLANEPIGYDSADFVMPLALGDFSGDGLVDFVTPELLFTSHRVGSSVQHVAAYQNRGEPWTMAVIADFNGNGVTDVAAATAGSPGLSFFNGTGTRYEVPTTLPTRGGVRFLTVGDFDGDLLNDLAFVETGAPASSTDALAVAFGRRDLPPLPASRVADLSNVEQLGSFADFGVDSLFAVSGQRRGGVDHTKVTLFEGGSDRLPIAPYSLVPFSTNGLLQDSLALTIALGAFSAPGSSDVIALGTDDLVGNWSLWLLPNIGLGEDPPRQLDVELPDGLKPVDFAQSKTLAVTVIAADIDGDRQDEAISLVAKADGGCALLIYEIDAARRTAAARQRIDFDESCLDPQLAARDVDNDGARADGSTDGTDLLVVMGESRQLSVLWNDRAGGFSATDSSVVADDVRGFDVFTKSLGLAFVTRDTLYTARSRPVARQLDRIEAHGAFHDLRSVVVTDPTGDGIEDIAVADAEGLWLIQAKLQ
jgi:hypothetical protein